MAEIATDHSPSYDQAEQADQPRSPFAAAKVDVQTVEGTGPATDAQIGYAFALLAERNISAANVTSSYISRAATLRTVIGWAMRPMADTTPPAASRVMGRGDSYGVRVNQVLAMLAGSNDVTALDINYRPLTKGAASELIKWLLTLPVTISADAVDAGAVTREDETLSAAHVVSAGRYALPIENSTVGNDLAFYKVDRPTEGKWAGRVFVSQITGPNETAVRGTAARTVLARIAVDVEGAAARYGHEIGRCGFCHLPLTNKASRERGIGPDCAKKYL